ncbi:hypothetical protein TNCV_2115031 [Trichonephila clavipes]|nr:hypothetical protein TNCV_2115031 [Trichonephila clavipes]
MILRIRDAIRIIWLDHTTWNSAESFTVFCNFQWFQDQWDPMPDAEMHPAYSPTDCNRRATQWLFDQRYPGTLLSTRSLYACTRECPREESSSWTCCREMAKLEISSNL